jgi:epoxyqueuosine reductase
MALVPGQGLLFTREILPILRGITVGGSSIIFYTTGLDPPHEAFQSRELGCCTNTSDLTLLLTRRAPQGFLIFQASLVQKKLLDARPIFVAWHCSVRCVVGMPGEQRTLGWRNEMTDHPITTPVWLIEWMEEHEITLWGAADLRDFSTPRNEMGQVFPLALSWALPMNPEIMAAIRNGPDQTYAAEYARVNKHINELSADLAAEIKLRGFLAKPLAASERTDTVKIKGDFPHKTAATRAGLGWVGRHCQLITRPFGSWVRLGSVFTDIEIPCGPPIQRNFCGRCTRCLEACPAKALKGNGWYPGIPREELLDVLACDKWKKEHYFQYQKGHVCGICSAVCPYGLKVLKKK